MLLAEKVLAIGAALDGLPHAFGGALALAYYAEPRATVDIDLNVFVTVDHFTEVADPLARLGVGMRAPGVVETAHQDGQVRAFWDDTPVDLFFAYDEFHDAAAAARRLVPFADTSIWILAADHLVVCKVIFDRPKDWVDIDAMRVLDTTLDGAEILRWVGRIAGTDDPRFERIATVLTTR